MNYLLPHDITTRRGGGVEHAKNRMNGGFAWILISKILVCLTLFLIPETVREDLGYTRYSCNKASSLTSICWLALVSSSFIFLHPPEDDKKKKIIYIQNTSKYIYGTRLRHNTGHDAHQYHALPQFDAPMRGVWGVNIKAANNSQFDSKTR